MKNKGHTIVITARNKDVLQKLLIAYDLPFISMGNGSVGKGALGKGLYLVYALIKLFFLFVKHKPDIVLSFGSTPCAVSAFLLNIPHIAFEDTEHAKLNRKLYAPLTSLICTPTCFYDDIGGNQFRFNGYMELFYLHKNRFKPDEEVLNKLGISFHNKLIFIRFVSWGAFHDIGQKGLLLEEKIKIVHLMRNYGEVYISSEGTTPDELKEFEIKLPPEKIHDVLNYTTLYIGEGGTMASECAMLGVPSIYINSLPLMGYLKDAKTAGLLFYLHDFEEICKKAVEIMENETTDFKKMRNEFLKDKIDPTAFLIWLIENYPESKNILKNDPDYQYQFK